MTELPLSLMVYTRMAMVGEEIWKRFVGVGGARIPRHLTRSGLAGSNRSPAIYHEVGPCRLQPVPRHLTRCGLVGSNR